MSQFMQLQPSLKADFKTMILQNATREIAPDAVMRMDKRSPLSARTATRPKSDSMRGFSLIELLIVVSIILTISAVTIINLPPALASMRMNSATNMTLEAIKLARGQAFANRAVYCVTFTLPGTLTVTQVATGRVVQQVLLPAGVAFDAEPGLPSTPATTPDGFGSGNITGPIDFDADFGLGGLNQLFFQPDGTARDGNGHVNNGVVYLAQPGNLSSSRAISIWGLTGRVKKWNLSINPATGVKAWGQS